MRNTMPYNYLDYTVHFDQLLGEGGFCRVYKATDPEGRIVAMKIPKQAVRGDTWDPEDEFNEKFEREVRVWTNLCKKKISGVVEVYDYGIHPHPWLAMEFMEGGTLVERAVSLSLDEKVALMKQLLQILLVVHLHGVIHRDIKPANILFTGDSVPKIADWGMAKALLTVKAATRNAARSTPYAAPEQFSAEDFGEVDWQTDIYQFGATCFELFTGRWVFPEEDEHRMMYKILKVKPELLTTLNSEVPENIAYIIQGCLEKRKKDRYQSLGAILPELRSVTPSEREEKDETNENRDVLAELETWLQKLKELDASTSEDEKVLRKIQKYHRLDYQDRVQEEGFCHLDTLKKKYEKTVELQKRQMKSMMEGIRHLFEECVSRNLELDDIYDLNDKATVAFKAQNFKELRFWSEYVRGEILYKEIEDFPGALEALRKARTFWTEGIEESYRFWAVYNRGEVHYHKLKNYQEALEHYQEARKLWTGEVGDRYHFWTIYNQAEILNHRLEGRKEEARDRYKEALAVWKPGAVEITFKFWCLTHIRKFHRFFSSGRERYEHWKSRSLAELEEALESVESLDIKDQGHVYYHLQMYHFEANNWNESIEAGEEATQKFIAVLDKETEEDKLFWGNKDIGSSFSFIGQAYRYRDNVLCPEARENLKTAIGYYKRAMKFKPDDFWVHKDKAVALYWLENYQEAIREYERAIEINPHEFWAHKDKANAHAYLKEYGKAIGEFTMALTIDPNHFRTYKDMGDAYHELRCYKEAKNAYEGALQIRPNDPDVRKLVKDTVEKYLEEKDSSENEEFDFKDMPQAYKDFFSNTRKTVKQELPFFPFIMSCSACGKKYRITHPSFFRCKQCSHEWEIDEEGREIQVRPLSSIQSQEFPFIMKCSSCGKKYRITHPSFFRCKQCFHEWEIDEEGREIQVRSLSSIQSQEFPFIMRCSACDKKYRITHPSFFRCKQCSHEWEIDEEGKETPLN